MSFVGRLYDSTGDIVKSCPLAASRRPGASRTAHFCGRVLLSEQTKSVSSCEGQRDGSRYTAGNPVRDLGPGDLELKLFQQECGLELC